MVSALHSRGLIKPLFDDSRGYFRIIFKRKNVYNNDPDKRKETGGQINEKQKEILHLLLENLYITRNELSNKLMINISAIQKHLEELKKKAQLKESNLQKEVIS